MPSSNLSRAGVQTQPFLFESDILGACGGPRSAELLPVHFMRSMLWQFFTVRRSFCEEVRSDGCTQARSFCNGFTGCTIHRGQAPGAACM